MQNLLFNNIDASNDPTQNELYKIIDSSHKSTISKKESHGQKVPFHVKKEINNYLKCGVLEHGFLRFKCSQCSHEKFVAFSCKGRTICPRCTGRVMASTAKNLVNDVIPPVSVRQWVLSLPYKHRYHLAYDKRLNTKVLNCIIRAISTFYKKRAKFLYVNENYKTGSIAVIQRFGGALNLNTHFHILFMDGVFNEQDFFLPVIPQNEDIHKLVKTLKVRINKIFKKEGLSEELLPEEAAGEDKGKAYHQLSILNLVEDKKGFSKPLEVGKLYDPPFEEFKGNRVGYCEGFSLHANSKIPGHARGALEKMCRYILRGPLAKSRLERLDKGRVLLRLKTPYKSGTTHLVLTNDQFMSRLIALIPPKRMNLIRYFGVFGANHKKRKAVTRQAKDSGKGKLKEKKEGKKKVYRTPWAQLLKHVFQEDVMACSKCAGTLEYVATINDTIVAKKILDHVLSGRERDSTESARGPPEIDLEPLYDTFDDFTFDQQSHW